MATWFKTAAAGLVIVIGLVGSIWGLPKVFTTVERHEIDQETIKSELAGMGAELAGVSLNQQAEGSRNQIRWLQQELYEIEKQYGTDPSRMPPEVRRRYLELIQQLEDERRFYNDIRTKLKK